MTLYVWLKYIHLLGLGVFLMAHGVSAGVSLAVRGRPLDSVTRLLLQLSIRATPASYAGLGVIVVTGVWMGFEGSWWRTMWIWTAIVILVLLIVVMSALSVPYHRARDIKEDTASASPLAKARPMVMLWVGVAGLVALVFLMVFKPF
jgi:hypothetical protein